MRLFLDQNIPEGTAVWLRRARPAITVFRTQELGLGTAPDAVVMAAAIERRAVMVTFDKGIGDLRAIPRGCAGIIVLRVRPTTAESAIDALQRIFTELSDGEIEGCLVVVDSVRARPQPI